MESSAAGTESPDSESKKRKRDGDVPKRKKRVFPGGKRYPDFAVDEADYLAISEMIEIRREASKKHTKTMSRRDLARSMTLTEYFLKLVPSTIGRLDCLTRIDFRRSQYLSSIPSSIGRLQKLEFLRLCDASGLSELPEEFGDLVSLKIVDISDSGLESIPPSIGRLRNLEVLTLDGSRGLSGLPEEVGSLKNLRLLDLSDSGIRCLPDSMAGLRNLESLLFRFASDTPKPNLSMEQSKNFWTNPKLRILDLTGSGVKVLPERVAGLKGLMHLIIDLTNIPERFVSSTDFQLEVANRSRYLGSISLGRNNEEPSKWRLEAMCDPRWEFEAVGDRDDGKTEGIPDAPWVLRSEKSLQLALARNRARYRTDAGNIPPGLWPHILRNPLHALDEYFPEYEHHEWDIGRGYLYHDWDNLLEEQTWAWDRTNDAVYQLLLQNHKELIGHRLPPPRYPRRRTRRRPPPPRSHGTTNRDAGGDDDPTRRRITKIISRTVRRGYSYRQKARVFLRTG